MAIVSVIIPVYNGEKTIEQTISSVLNQTLTDFELIIINDDSKDGTLEIVHQIKDPRIKVFSYARSGVSASRNYGIAHACSEFVAFLDADDLWTPDKLEAQLKVLQENPQAGVAYSWTNCIDESGKFLRPASHISASGNVYEKLLLTNFLDSGSNLLVRREAFNEVGVFDESVSPAEDWDMWLRLAARYHFVAVPSPQVLYRVYPNSSSANVWKLEAACLQVIERAFQQVPQSLKPLKKHSLGNLYKYLTYKVIEGYADLNKGVTPVIFIWHSVINDPTLLRTRVIWKILLKISVMLILPPKLAQALMSKFKGIFNTTAILAHRKL